LLAVNSGSPLALIIIDRFQRVREHKLADLPPWRDPAPDSGARLDAGVDA
jgi:hypothetical protein